MRKILIVLLLTLVLFFVEFFLFDLIGKKFIPHFLIILLVFLDLLWGIRFSLFAAVLAGLLKDSFAVHLFGVNVLALVFCAFMITILRKYIYQKGSQLLRIVLVGSTTILYTLSLTIIYSLFVPIQFSELMGSVLLPGLISTIVVTPLTFNFLKKCASKLLV